MGRVIAITSGLGGVGKTTATAYLGTALARSGKTVVMIDADTGGLYSDLGYPNLDVIADLEIPRTAINVSTNGMALSQVLVDVDVGLRDDEGTVPRLRFLATCLLYTSPSPRD